MASEHDADAEIVEAIRSAVDTLNELQSRAAEQDIEFDIDGTKYVGRSHRMQVHYRLEIVKRLWRDGDDE